MAHPTEQIQHDGSIVVFIIAASMLFFILTSIILVGIF